MALLQVHNLEVHYGPIRALMGIDLEVHEGEIVALVGANGAGKTSTMHAICGIVPLAAGRIEYAGQRLDGLPAHRIMTLGIAHVPEGRQIFTHMSLRDNLLLGATHRSPKSHLEKDINEVMAQFPLLQHRLSERAFNLSGGELQMLALARGLMAHPKLLLLDEPSLGLAPMAVNEVFHLIDALRSQGITILLVEQNIRRALMIANRGYILESGRIILSGPAPMLLHNDLVKRAYLGDTHYD